MFVLTPVSWVLLTVHLGNEVRQVQGTDEGEVAGVGREQALLLVCCCGVVSQPVYVSFSHHPPDTNAPGIGLANILGGSTWLPSFEAAPFAAVVLLLFDMVVVQVLTAGWCFS
jgi:hypothetical protein